jgi:Kef-type K+ transport system membrane component KefB
MKNKKLFLVGAVIMTALGVFAGHGEHPPYPNFNLPRVEEMMFLVIQIGIILFAARLGGMAASFLKMPSILGELAAGIVIGPWALGGIGFGPSDGLFANGIFHGAALKEMVKNGTMVDATTPALYGIATLASIILLFLSGLETNLKMFFK